MHDQSIKVDIEKLHLQKQTKKQNLVYPQENPMTSMTETSKSFSAANGGF